MKRTLVILSGGLDSTVLAYYLRQSPEYQLIGAVSVDYGQRHKRELLCAEKTCETLAIKHHWIDLGSLGALLSKSSLTGSSEVPEGHYSAENMKSTVVPNRNMILIAVALGMAINEDATAVAYGAHAGDHAIYPDCRVSFANAMDTAAMCCDEDPRELVRPFIKKTKADIVKLGRQMRVPFENTHTCYNGKARACGRCGTCVERLEAFTLAGITDPMEYEDRDYWRDVTFNQPKKERLS